MKKKGKYGLLKKRRTVLFLHENLAQFFSPKIYCFNRFIFILFGFSSFYFVSFIPRFYSQISLSLKPRQDRLKRLINKSIAPILHSSPVQTRLYNSHTDP